MQRLGAITREKIISLSKEGRSLNFISDHLSLGKSTVYYWYRKSSTRKIVPIVIDYSNDEKIGEIIGVFAGDGNFYFDKNNRYQIRISVNLADKMYISYLESLLFSLFGKKPALQIREKYNVAVLRVLSKTVYEFLKTNLEWNSSKTQTVHLKNASEHSEKFLIGFLRGLIDTDGHLKSKRATFTTISPKLADNIEEILNLLGIAYKKNVYDDKRIGRKMLFRIYVTRDFDKFIEIVRPKHIII